MKTVGQVDGFDHTADSRGFPVNRIVDTTMISNISDKKEGIKICRYGNSDTEQHKDSAYCQLGDGDLFQKTKFGIMTPIVKLF